MKPGHELDKLVAEKVMGWNTSMRQCDGWNYHDDSYPNSDSRIFAPSTDIAHAWDVLEEMRHRHVYLDVIQTNNGFMVGDGSENYADDEGFTEGKLINIGLAETAPHAICIASIRACGVEVEP